MDPELTGRGDGPVRLDRRQFVARFMHGLSDALVVTGLGAPSYDVYAAGERPQNFYLWGAMGGAVPLALGLALARPERPVVVVTGDGEQLMGMGSLATVGVIRPDNLTVVVLDNGHFGETGMQLSHSGLGIDLVGVARACSIQRAFALTKLPEADELAALALEKSATTFARVLVAADSVPRVLPPRDGVANKIAFRASLGLSGF